MSIVTLRAFKTGATVETYRADEGQHVRHRQGDAPREPSLLSGVVGGDGAVTLDVPTPAEGDPDGWNKCVFVVGELAGGGVGWVLTEA